PVPGIWELREAIAGLYNRLYRRGIPSQYTAENVSVSGGGRASLTRAAASLGHVNLGHFLPDYTAYEELLDIFKAFTAIPILLEGGGSKPLQRAAIPLLADAHVVAETNAIHAAFRVKRDRLLSGLERLGVRTDRAPDGTFYVWGKVDGLPPPLNDGMGFFRAALEKQVIAVPGEFFDVNPGKRRSQRASRFRRHVRFSFGPAMDNLETALARLETLIHR